MKGTYDCPNRECSRYHDLVTWPYENHQTNPACPGCGGRMRLVSVAKEMTETAKKLIREHKQKRREEEQSLKES